VPNISPALAAWLHIGPDSDTGVQRLHVAKVSDKLRENTVSLGFLPSHLASDIANALSIVTGDDWYAEVETLAAALDTGANFRLSLGGGMFATVCPADPATGANLRPLRSPVDLADLFEVQA
jgi:hypothetical protein